jgi:hypothetical protein
MVICNNKKCRYYGKEVVGKDGKCRGCRRILVKKRAEKPVQDKKEVLEEEEKVETIDLSKDLEVEKPEEKEEDDNRSIEEILKSTTPPPEGEESIPSEPGRPQVQVPTDAKQFGEDIGEVICSIAEAWVHEPFSVDERRGIRDAMGRLAMRHPEWFRGWMADAMDILIIVGIIMTKKANKDKRDAELIKKVEHDKNKKEVK